MCCFTLFVSSFCDACEVHATYWYTYEWSWGADAAGRQKVNARALTEALDAMRELSSLHATLPLLASTGLVNTFKQLTSHQVGSVKTTLCLCEAYNAFPQAPALRQNVSVILRDVR